MASQVAELRQRAASIGEQLARLKPQLVYAGTFNQPGPTHLLYRGEPAQPREQVMPGAIAAVSPPLVLPADAAESERRAALARWIASPDNPLAARVAVNRLWHYHFGQGLVRTPSDFGFNGGLPSHPELLDWLACELVEGGWRFKAIHRQIVLSSTYRQASRARGEAAKLDADNRLLWRVAPRRLEAEAIRDALLATSGALDLRMGGPGYDAFEPNTNYVKVYTPRRSFGPAEWRRMVYQQKPRMRQDGTFGEFDCPDSSQPMPRRNVSTTALQALNLLNGPLVVEQSEIFAKRLASEAGDEPAAQVRRAFAAGLRPPARRRGAGRRRAADRRRRFERVVPRLDQCQRVLVCPVSLDYRTSAGGCSTGAISWRPPAEA